MAGSAGPRPSGREIMKRREPFTMGAHCVVAGAIRSRQFESLHVGGAPSRAGRRQTRAQVAAARRRSQVCRAPPQNGVRVAHWPNMNIRSGARCARSPRARARAPPGTSRGPWKRIKGRRLACLRAPINQSSNQSGRTSGQTWLAAIRAARLYRRATRQAPIRHERPVVL